jgi:hypothetical protein
MCNVEPSRAGFCELVSRVSWLVSVSCLLGLSCKWTIIKLRAKCFFCPIVSKFYFLSYVVNFVW